MGSVTSAQARTEDVGMEQRILCAMTSQHNGAAYACTTMPLSLECCLRCGDMLSSLRFVGQLFSTAAAQNLRRRIWHKRAITDTSPLVCSGSVSDVQCMFL